MACTQTENFYFAIRKDTGEPVHISYFSQLPDEEKEKYRGQRCNCICAACKKPLEARLGRGKHIPHFAHKPEENQTQNCSAQKVNESYLHEMAKKIVKESTYINLPVIEIEAECDQNRNLDDGEQCQPLILKQKRKLLFSDAKTEVHYDGFIPDVCICSGNSVLLVEIVVTHYIDIEKYNRIKQAGLPTIEIDISRFLKNIENLSEDELREELIKSVEHKKWIYNSLRDAGIEQLKRRNKKLQEELESQIRKEEERRIGENENTSQTWHDNDYCRLKTDKDFYLSYSEKLVNNEQALKEINALGMCDLNFLEVKDIPFYFNIPVFGQIAFNCDRRIWQAILFEKFIYRQQGTKIQIKKVYYYFGEKHSDKFNSRFCDFSKEHFPEDSFLRYAIHEYMLHLVRLGFIDDKFEELDEDKEYLVLRPKSGRYAEYLKQALLEMQPTNQPFHYLQEGWEKSNLNGDKRKSF